MGASHVHTRLNKQEDGVELKGCWTMGISLMTTLMDYKESEPALLVLSIIALCVGAGMILWAHVHCSRRLRGL